VIRTLDLDGAIGLTGELPSGAVAFVDADWIASEPGQPVPAIVIAGGTARFATGEPVPVESDLDDREAASRVLGRVAREAADAARELLPVEVWGTGAIATTVAALLGVTARLRGGDQPPEERPRAIVETTGDPEAISEATRRLADLGTLVLTGEPLGRALPLNLYPDVHSRGLVLVGVRPPLAATGTDAEAERAPELPAPAPALLGSPLPEDARWLRVA